MGNRALTNSGNSQGKSVAFVLPTPLFPYMSWVVRGALRFLNRRRDTEQITARRLSFIPFLHWSVVSKRHFNAVHDESASRDLPRYDYNLFLSTFDGPWGPYVDAFADVLSHAIDFVWSFSVGYPGTRPESQFKRYIRQNQLDADHHYTAYPGASVHDVRRALHLNDELTNFVEMTRGLDDTQFAQEFRRLLVRVQNDLGTLGVA